MRFAMKRSRWGLMVRSCADTATTVDKSEAGLTSRSGAGAMIFDLSDLGTVDNKVPFSTDRWSETGRPRFRRQRGEEHFSRIRCAWKILIQKSSPSDSIIAHFPWWAGWGDEFCNTFALSHTFEAMLALFWKECEWIIIVRDAFRRLE
jgi:hypothetical protein